MSAWAAWLAEAPWRTGAYSEGLQEGAGHQQCQLLERKPGVSLPGDDVFVAPFAERNLASCLYSKPRQTPQSHHLRWS